MKCPSCNENMQQRSGKFGDFWFCPEQHICLQKTITIKPNPLRDPDYHIEPSHSVLEGEMRKNSLYMEAVGLESSMGGMASMAYENDREHERTRDRASVDANMVLSGGMFCDMGMEDDDEDQRPW